MTCIVGLLKDGHIWLGGDSGAFDASGDKEIRRNPKVIKKNHMLLGFCGSFRIAQVVEHCFEAPPYANSSSTMGYLVCDFVPALRECLAENKVIKDDECDDVLPGSAILVGYRNGLYLVEDDLNVSEHPYPFIAMGSGCGPAVGALYQQWVLGDDRDPEIRLSDALKVSCIYVATVSEPFNFVSTRKVK